MTLRTVLFAGAVGISLLAGARVTATASADDPVYSPVLAAMNARLRAAGVTNVAIEKAELLFDASAFAGQATTILANDRTHLLSSLFVENDPRRGGGSEISYLIDQSDGLVLSFTPAGTVVVLSNAETEPELDASIAAWAAMKCNGPGIVKVPDTGADPDIVDGLVLANPNLVGTSFADVTFAGWLPGAFFNAVIPNGSGLIIGATFTLVFLDINGNPTDLDRDGRADTALREIYFNLAFAWGTGSNPLNIDIQTAATHEAGHGFGLAHFGKIFLNARGVLQFAPKAIMNAGYTAEDREIRGSDIASFCHIWAN